MTAFRAVAALRFREALAGRMLWLLPLHFLVAFAVVRTLPGPTFEARLQAADATALGLAAVLGLVAAAVLGASPLATERLRPRGSLVIAAPVSPSARVLATALGTGAALLLLVLALAASAMAAVDLGVGGAPKAPTSFTRASEIRTGRPDPGEPGLFWTDQKMCSVEARFPRRLAGGETLVVDTRTRPGESGTMPGTKKAAFIFLLGAGDDRRAVGHSELRVPASAPFRVTVPAACDEIAVLRARADLDLGFRLDGIRAEEGTKPRALARGLHAAALFGGLLAVMAAAMALSTVAGAGVAAGGALALAGLSLSQPLFADAADTLAYAGSMERAIQATLHPGQVAVALTGTPPALAPVFRAVAAVLPDGTGFDLTAAVAANEVPWSGDVSRAAMIGSAIAALFLAAAVLGARRRP